jgi:hypothetical protein
VARWYRVFGGVSYPDPAAVLAELVRLDPTLTAHFHGDDDGWFRALVRRADGPPILEVDRYLASEEGIRAELNAWAAWVEAAGDDPRHAALMARLSTAAQLFTLRPADDPPRPETDRLGSALCGVLATLTAGVWQADGRGILDADGTVLVPDQPDE